MTKPSYVYVVYIATTPEKVWEAITDAEVSARFWHRSNVSDWQVGSAWEHKFPGKPADLVGKVLEADPPRRLVLTWAGPAHVDNPERVSCVAFDIQQMGGKTRLTMSHTELTPQGLKDVSEAWPAVLSNMKTLLETGEVIPDAFEGIHG
ncbi:MAG TPA: SRPBCC family protein [Phenylobacterium sp.]|nr:SRPBCC family protein [Phenylobacterium sp.]